MVPHHVLNLKNSDGELSAMSAKQLLIMAWWKEIRAGWYVYQAERIVIPY
jgi:hypothetical protein